MNIEGMREIMYRFYLLIGKCLKDILPHAKLFIDSHRELS